jgi:hypothetical protein
MSTLDLPIFCDHSLKRRRHIKLWTGAVRIATRRILNHSPEFRPKLG